MPLHINEKDVYIATNIRCLRKKMRWSLESLAFSLGISIQQLQKYEMAVNKISASMLFELSQIFEMPMEKFFQHVEPRTIDEHNVAFKVMLVEDDVQNEIIIREAIEDFPEKTSLYSIQEGAKALNFLHKLKDSGCKACVMPDLILLELNLEKTNGLEILKDIKRDNKLEYIPVVALTDRENLNEITSSYSFQAGGLIVKSCSVDELKKQVQQTLIYWSQLVTLPKEHDIAKEV